MFSADNFDPIPLSAHPPNVLQHPAQHIVSTPNAHPAQESYRTPAHLPHSEPAHDEPYTAREIADFWDVQDVTIRTRWYPHLLKVASERNLRSGKGYSRLAWDLFADFHRHVKRGSMTPETWIQDARKRFAATDTGIGEVVDCELLPPEVGGQLAIAENRLTQFREEGNTKKDQLLEVIKQAQTLRANLSTKEIETARQRGQNRAVAKFQVEFEAELETEAELRKMMTE
jgi:hypothetical protein